jgi:hypothetical protein
MRKKNEEREKIIKLLESVKPPELSDEEIETYKNEFQGIIADKFSDIIAERERKIAKSRKIYYSLASVSLIIVLLTVGLLVIKPFLNREAVIKTIKNKLSIEISIEDVLLKDGEGIVINDNREIVVNISSGGYKTYSPMPYEPSQEEKDKAVQIVRSSEEAKSFVIKEGEAPVNISENPIILIQGYEFPHSGMKYVEVSLKFTPSIQPPRGYMPMSSVKFTVDIAKGKVLGAKEK